jgi:murein L,D-transpeptidase YcbB/YkuD
VSTFVLPTPALARRATPRRGALSTLLGALFDGAVADAIPALPARQVQERLVALGLLSPAAVSGRFDRPTADAVARFQARTGLPADGVPGRRTADLLLATAIIAIQKEPAPA